MKLVEAVAVKEYLLAPKLVEAVAVEEYLLALSDWLWGVEGSGLALCSCLDPLAPLSGYLAITGGRSGPKTGLVTVIEGVPVEECLVALSDW